MFKYLPPDTVTYGSQKLKFKGMDMLFGQINEFIIRYIGGYSVPTEYPLNGENTGSGMLMANEEKPDVYVCILNYYDVSTSLIFNTPAFYPLLLPAYHYLIPGSNQKVGESLILSSGLFSPVEIRQINRVASKVNAILKSYFDRREKKLIEILIRFRIQKDKLAIIPEFNPLTIKLLDPLNPDLLNFAYTKSLNFKKYSNFVLEAINHND